MNTTTHSIHSVHSSLLRCLRGFSAMLLVTTPLFASCNMNTSAPTVNAPSAEGREFQLNAITVTYVFGDTSLRDLARAAAAGQAEQVAKIVKAGVNPNQRGKQEFTPLFWALSARNVAGIQALLQNGADPNLPIHMKNNIGEWDEYAVVSAARVQSLDLLRVLLEHGANPESYSSRDTPLTAAASCLDCIKLLVKHGADINRPTPTGRVLSQAVPPNDLDTYLYLLDQGYRMKLDHLAWHLLDRIESARPERREKRLQIVARIRAMGIEPFVPEWQKQELEEKQKKEDGKKD